MPPLNDHKSFFLHIPLHLVYIDFHDARDNLYIYNLREKSVSYIENIKTVFITTYAFTYGTQVLLNFKPKTRRTLDMLWLQDRYISLITVPLSLDSFLNGRVHVTDISVP